MMPRVRVRKTVDGRREPFDVRKIGQRLCKLCHSLNESHVRPSEVAGKVANGLYGDVATAEVDSLAAETAAAMTTLHPDYAILAGRIVMSRLHKETDSSFSRKCVRVVHDYRGCEHSDAAMMRLHGGHDFMCTLCAARACRHDGDLAWRDDCDRRRWEQQKQQDHCCCRARRRRLVH